MSASEATTVGAWQRWRTPWRIVGSVLAVVLLVGGVVRVVGFLARSSEPLDADFDAGEVSQLYVAVSTGSVEIVGTDSPTIRVRGTINSGLGRPEHSERVDGDRLLVTNDCPPGPFSQDCGGDYRIEVPRDLAVEVRGGDVDARLSDLDGTVDVRVSNNPIIVRRLGGTVRLETSNDRVDAQGLTAARATIIASNDSVDAEFSEAPEQVRIRTSNDQVTLVVPDTDVFYAVSLSTSNGEQRSDIRTDPASDRTIEIETSNDDVTVSYPQG